MPRERACWPTPALVCAGASTSSCTARLRLGGGSRRDGPRDVALRGGVTLRYRLNRGDVVGDSGGREVRVVDMATVLGHVDGDVDLLKMDIEGGEGELLGGDLAWLRRMRALMVEFHPEVVDVQALIALLERHGFRHIPAGSVEPRAATAFVRT